MQASSRPTQTSHTVAAPQDEPPEAPPPWQSIPRYKPLRCSADSAEVLSTKLACKIRTEPADKKTAAAKLFPSVTFPAPAPPSKTQGPQRRPESAWQAPALHGIHRWMLPVHPCQSAGRQTGPADTPPPKAAPAAAARIQGPFVRPPPENTAKTLPPGPPTWAPR